MPSSSPPRSFVSSRRRRHTRWPRDWSSDVCSSDLCKGAVFTPLNKQLMNDQIRHIVNHAEIEVVVADPRLSEQLGKIGRASCRGRVQRAGGGAPLTRARKWRGGGRESVESTRA